MVYKIISFFCNVNTIYFSLHLFEHRKQFYKDKNHILTVKGHFGKNETRIFTQKDLFYTDIVGVSDIDNETSQMLTI